VCVAEHLHLRYGRGHCDASERPGDRQRRQRFEPDTFGAAVVSEPASDRAPILLLADSRLLFARNNDGSPLMQRLCGRHAGSDAKAAYIGASNGDRPEFYSIFEGAMDLASIGWRRMVGSVWHDDDRSWLEAADVIVLAGGDVERGWNTFRSTGMGDVIVARYLAGALLIGVSAGAVQLGLRGWRSNEAVDEPLHTFGLVPYVVNVHEEDRQWDRLKRLVSAVGGPSHGLGIPRGGGVLYHVGRALEPLGAPTVEITTDGKSFEETLLVPGVPTDADD